MRLLTFAVLSLSTSLVAGHARISKPKPLDAPPENPSGNAYNAPLAPDGSEFPCKNLHKKAGVDKTPTESWRAGSVGLFEILGHITAGEGALAAHSGGSCQASISFDDGLSFHVLHTYHGGCPRDVPFNSNIAGPNQTFTFDIPPETKSGPALFSWTWTAATGNRDEFYMNCAAVEITGSGTSTLDDYPDMYVGDMDIPGQIADGECRSIAGTAILYPNPGPAERITVTTVAGLPFHGPTGGNCVAPGGKAVVVSSAVSVGSSAAVATPVVGSATSGSAYSVSTAVGSAYVASVSTDASAPGYAYSPPGSTYIASVSTPGYANKAPASTPASIDIASDSTPGYAYVAPASTYISSVSTPGYAYIAPASTYIASVSTPGYAYIAPASTYTASVSTPGYAYVAPASTPASTDIAPVSTAISASIIPTPTPATPEPSDISAADDDSDLDDLTPEASSLPAPSDAPHSHYRHTHTRHGHYRTTITTTICPSSSTSEPSSSSEPEPSASPVYAGWKHRRHRAA